MHALNHQHQRQHQRRHQRKYTCADLEFVVQDAGGGEGLGRADASKAVELDCLGISVVLGLYGRSHQALEHNIASRSLRRCLLCLLVHGRLEGGGFFDRGLLRAPFHLAFIPRKEVCAVGHGVGAIFRDDSSVELEEHERRNPLHLEELAELGLALALSKVERHHLLARRRHHAPEVLIEAFLVLVGRHKDELKRLALRLELLVALHQLWGEAPARPAPMSCSAKRPDR